MDISLEVSSSIRFTLLETSRGRSPAENTGLPRDGIIGRWGKREKKRANDLHGSHKRIESDRNTEAQARRHEKDNVFQNWYRRSIVLVVLTIVATTVALSDFRNALFPKSRMSNSLSVRAID